MEISGYFQSEKYFKKFRNEVLELFEPDSITENKIKEFFSNFNNIETCSIHVRRGNYVDLKNYHFLQDIEYYKNSIDIIGSNIHFLIFSDDIDWCKENFSFLENKTFIDNFLDYEQMYLMSLCSNNIISSSTFSWWGAYFARQRTPKKDSFVACFPKNWGRGMPPATDIIPSWGIPVPNSV